ncbi:glycosyltransferase [Legionella drancourtii]|uniref:Glycosyl transferase, group 1 n=1 Tax=Legionella drancourtii LLAP12 TaxID=658187 RepID=G9ETW2_9GAMM|nr:glycosyltransferase [Legionella drancourtii]EHL29313.1 glycosyl transferase, group 1 [Legionella drancourtii LLAP12]
MNILHVYKTFLNDTFGGVEQTIYQMAKANDPRFSHTVLSLSKDWQETEITHEGIKNLCYKENFSIASNSISFSLLRDFNKIAQKTDVIHYHFPWPFADVLHLFWRIKKPSVLTYHSDIVRQQQLLFFYRPLMNRFLSSVDRIVATSPNYLASSPTLQKYKDKVTAIPIGLNRASYPVPTAEQYTYWRNSFGNRFFLFIGVLRYYKGLHILLDALKNTTFPVLIVGTGPLEEELKVYANKLNLTHVHFLGRLSDTDKMALLDLCLSVLFPSHLRSEAFGISLLEGAMMGKPLISAEIGTGTSFINVNGETGFVIPPDDAVALRDAMQFIWDNPRESALMGENAAARYQALFTGDRMVAEYGKVYEDIVSSKHGSKFA